MTIRQVLVNPCAVLGLLSLLTYLPVLLFQPLISDDYIQIHLGRIYGPVSTWPQLASDALYRCRATSIVLTHWTECLLGVAPFHFYATSLLLHGLASWLVYRVGVRIGLTSNASLLGAAFFAVYEGHQEAVMWYASLPELLLFLFCGGFILCWIRWIDTGSVVWYAVSLLQMALALLSKEPAVILVPVAMALIVWRKARWTLQLYVLPMALAAAVYTGAIFAAKQTHLHLNDGTFSLHAPFVQTWLRSLFRMLWFWGLLAAGWFCMYRRRMPPWTIVLWMGIALLPFCFLLYMPHIPSRHVYLASAGLALLIGLALEDLPRRAAIILCAAILVHNIGYIWIKKRAQYLERAEPTERLLREIRAAGGKRPVNVCNFPYARETAVRMVEIVVKEDPESVLTWKDPDCGDMPR